MMNIVRRHTATIVVAMVTAAATAGGTALAGQIINADRLEGYRADQLIRAAEKHRDGGVLRSARGKGGTQILSVNITAPRARVPRDGGILRRVPPGGSSRGHHVRDQHVLPRSQWSRDRQLPAHDAARSGRRKQRQREQLRDQFRVARRERPAHRSVDAQSSGSVIYDEASLNVLYVPFNGRGNVPDPEPVQPPAAASIGNN